MTRRMDDALHPSPQEPPADIFAYYVDMTTEAEVAALWPGKLYVSIARLASEDALCCDVESTDLSPGQVPAWVVRQRRRGVAYPWAYVDRANWPAARAACVQAGVPEPLWWVAVPGAGATIPAGAVAVQWQYAGTYDVSWVLDFVPGLDSQESDDMDPTQAQQLQDIHDALFNGPPGVARNNLSVIRSQLVLMGAPWDPPTLTIDGEVIMYSPGVGTPEVAPVTPPGYRMTGPNTCTSPDGKVFSTVPAGVDHIGWAPAPAGQPEGGYYSVVSESLVYYPPAVPA